MQLQLSALTGVMYRRVLKPIFFLQDAERVHHHMVTWGIRLGQSSLAKSVMRWMWASHERQLIQVIDGITFPNPVGLAAGFDYNGQLSGILPAVGFGFHTIGTVTLHPYEGNLPPRLGRFPRSRALLVNKGLKNDGAAAIIKRLAKIKFTIPTGISIASTNKAFASEKAQISDMVKCFTLFEKSRVHHHYYELNISCPNTFGGEPFTSPSKLQRLMTQIDQLKLTRPLYVKMPIDQSKAETLALLTVLARHRVQGVVFGNLTKDKQNPAVDKRDRQLWLQRRGNLSGKPTWLRSNALIRLTRQRYRDRFTIIGTGGVFSGPDARTKMKLGADLIQVITGMVYQGPQLIGQVNKLLASTAS